MPAITPNDIVNKEFRLAFRGYAAAQVDDFLQQVSDSLYQALEENQRLRAQVEDLQGRLGHYQQTEELIKHALVLAERTAEETRQRARQEAESIRRDAEEKIRDERRTLEEMRHTRYRILAELRALLQAHLSLLETQEAQQPVAGIEREGDQG